MKTTFDRISAMTVEQRDKLTEQFEKASRVAGAEPIAVVGIGCRLPGGVTGPDGFWKLLESGTDAVTEVPADRWDAEAFYDPDLSAPGRMPTKWGAYLDDVTGFSKPGPAVPDAELGAVTDPEGRAYVDLDDAAELDRFILERRAP